jgi:DNA replication and repair protein RecF
MKVESLQIRNFRNIRYSDFAPHPGLNFLIGLNAQGKTSVLEAMSFLSGLRSFRHAKPQEVIQWNQMSAEVACRLFFSG